MLNVNVLGMGCAAICMFRAAMGVKFDETDIGLLLIGVLLFFV